MNPDLRKRMIDAAQESDRLSYAEKETAINYLKPDDRATVHTEEAGMIRRLLGHPNFEIDFVVQETSDGHVRFDADDAAEEFDGRRRLVAVDGTIPIGCLKISANPRSSSGHAAVVSDATSLEGQADD